MGNNLRRITASPLQRNFHIPATCTAQIAAFQLRRSGQYQADFLLFRLHNQCAVRVPLNSTELQRSSAEVPLLDHCLNFVLQPTCVGTSAVLSLVPMPNDNLNLNE